MAVQTWRVTLNATTAVPILVSGSAGRNSVLVRNNDASIIVYIGAAGVTATTGFPIPAATTLPALDLEVGDDLYAIAASGAPVVVTLTRA